MLKKEADYKQIAKVTFDETINSSKILSNAIFDLGLDKKLTYNKNRIDFQIALFIITFCEFKIIENFGIIRTEQSRIWHENYCNELKSMISKYFETDEVVVAVNLRKAEEIFYSKIKECYNPWGECGSDQLKAVGYSLERIIMKPTIKDLFLSFSDNSNTNNNIFIQKVSEHVHKIYLKIEKLFHE